MLKKIILTFVLLDVVVIILVFYFHYTAVENKQFKMIFFNIGQGDSALIRFSDGEKMLVDCGPDRKVLSKLGKYLPFFDRKIDYLVVSHPDNDHYAGCVDVLKNYEVKNVFINGITKEQDGYWRTWDSVLHSEGAIIKVVTDPFQLDIAGTKLNFLTPDQSFPLASMSDNDHSIIFKLINDKTSALFTGDMEQPLENDLLAKYCSSTPLDCPAISADILKVGHHGSDSSSGKDFLAAVDPKIAVVSVGKNTFGHPSFRVLKKLERIGAEIWRTDEKDDIIIKY